LKIRHFSSDAEVVTAAEAWLDGKLLNFFSGLQKLEQRAKKCIELRREYAEQIPSLVAVACFLPGRSKDLSAHPHIYMYIYTYIYTYIQRGYSKTWLTV
jgi:hypothetical protein